MNSRGRHGVGGYRAKPSGENPHDFFPTPPAVTHVFMEGPGRALPDGLWCEPAVGAGDIVRAVGERTWVTYDVRDVQDPGAALHHPRTDFLREDLAPGTFDVVITNPPFYLAEEFVRKALSCATHVVMLLRLAFLETRRREALHAQHPSDVYVLSRRPSFTNNGATDSAAYAWFVWGPRRGHRWSILVTPEPRKQ